MNGDARVGGLKFNVPAIQRKHILTAHLTANILVISFLLWE